MKLADMLQAGRAVAALVCLLTLTAALAGCRQPASPGDKSASSSRIVIETSDQARQSAGAGRRAGSRPDVRLVSGATEAEVGIAFYPGARLTSSQLVREGNDLTAGAELVTKDPYRDVLDFYRHRYASPELKLVEQEVSDGKLTLLNWRDPQGNYTVGVRRDEKRKQTTITLARVKSARKPRQVSP